MTLRLHVSTNETKRSKRAGMEMSRSLLNLRTGSDGSLVGVRIASTKTNGPNNRGQGAANDEENRGSAANASREWGRPGASAPGGADARGMTITRHHLLAWVHAHGLAALDELFREEAVALAGPKGRHQ